MPPVRELQTGLWHWEARHPDWTPEQGWTPEQSGSAGWGPEVSSYAIDDGERLLLFDPLAVPGEIEELASGRETAVVLTCPWHRRDAPSLAERLGVPIYVPPPDQGDPDPVEGDLISAGERLPVGVEAFPGMEPNDLVLWVESRRALVAGDTLVERGRGLEFPAEPGEVVKGVPAEQILEGLRPLLELPVELVLPTHGAPTDRAALERALSDARGLLMAGSIVELRRADLASDTSLHASGDLATINRISSASPKARTTTEQRSGTSPMTAAGRKVPAFWAAERGEGGAGPHPLD